MISTMLSYIIVIINTNINIIPEECWNTHKESLFCKEEKSYKYPEKKKYALMN